MQRLAPFLMGLVLAAYAATTTISLIALNWSDPSQTEGAGLSVLFGACAGFMAIGFIAKPAFFPSRPLGRFALRTFAVSWFLAMLVNYAGVVVRTQRPPLHSVWDLAIEFISWTVVTLIFSIPGLVAVLLSRSVRPTA